MLVDSVLTVGSLSVSNADDAGVAVCTVVDRAGMLFAAAYEYKF